MFARFSLAASIVLSTLSLAPAARAGATLADTWIEPGSGMEFVLIKGDCYLMGDTFGDGEHNEVPVHEVCLDDYYLGKYEVTQGQWQRVMGDNPAEYAHGENHPVESVMLTEIDAFIHRLNRSSGEVFRLPSEAEWEFACRGGGQAVKYGTADKHISPHNAHIGGEATSPWPGTAPVGSFAANALGVHGSVRQCLGMGVRHLRSGCLQQTSTPQSTLRCARPQPSGPWRGLVPRRPFCPLQQAPHALPPKRALRHHRLPPGAGSAQTQHAPTRTIEKPGSTWLCG